MEYKFNFKLLLGAVTIAILTAGCQLSSPSNSVAPNNSTENTSDGAATNVSTPLERISDLNLTDAQKAQAKQIGEQTQAQILAVLTPEQQEKFKSASQGQQFRVLRSLNLSAEQKQKIREIQRNQRQQFQGILTPEQKAKLQQNRSSRRQGSSN